MDVNRIVLPGTRKLSEEGEFSPKDEGDILPGAWGNAGFAEGMRSCVWPWKTQMLKKGGGDCPAPPPHAHGGMLGRGKGAGLDGGHG